VRASAALVVGIALLAALPAGALFFSVAGGWTLPVGAGELAGAAGSDFAAEQTSAANAVVVDVTGALLDTEPWTVAVHRVDSSWDGALTLSAARTTSGIGGGTISGGLAFQTVGLAAQNLFHGTGNRSAIQVAFRLSGLTVTMGSRIFSTQVVLTLLDT